MRGKGQQVCDKEPEPECRGRETECRGGEKERRGREEQCVRVSGARDGVFVMHMCTHSLRTHVYREAWCVRASVAGLAC